MIALGIVDLLTGLLFVVVNLLPSWSPPSAITSGGTVQTSMASLGGYAAGFSAWIPYGVFGAAATVILAAFTLAFGIWLIRRVVGIGTLGKVQ